ncbi:MAG: MATE family efflux transporter [Lachnospiraceae bacterium]
MQKINVQTYQNFLKRLLIIAVPIILSNLISELQMMIDRIFLGHVNSLYMSAIGNVNSPVWTTMSFCFSLVVGASIMISQGVGAGNTDKIEEYAAAMLKWNNVIPILLFFFWTFCGKYVYSLMGVSENVMPMCLEYTKYFAPVFLVVGLEASSMVIMQTSNYTKPLIYYGIVRAGLNMFLDWVLIFGKFGLPAMGLKGAAIATTIAEYAGCLYALYIFVTSKKLPTRPSFRAVCRAKMKPFLVSAKLGINTAFEDFAWNFGNLMLIRILNSINEMAAGIYSIIFGIEVIVVVIIGAIGNGTMTLTGEATGKKDVKQYKGVCVIAYSLCVLIAFSILLICIGIPEQIIGLFTTDNTIIQSCGLYLILMCVNLYGKSANIIIGNGIRGSGNTKWMFYTQIFGTIFIIGCASLFVYVFHLGITGVFLAIIVDELVRAGINFTKMLKIIKTFDEEKGKDSYSPV